jgi:hypothetical protein
MTAPVRSAASFVVLPWEGDTGRGHIVAAKVSAIRKPFIESTLPRQAGLPRPQATYMTLERQPQGRKLEKIACGIK